MGFSRRKIYPRLGGAIFGVDVLQFPLLTQWCCHVCQRFLCRQRKYQMSLFQLGEVLPNTLEALVLFFSRIFCVWPLFMCCHLATRCKCQVSSTGRRRFFGTLWCRPWRAPMDLETRGSSSGCHWSWIIELTRKERWQILQMLFTDIRLDKPLHGKGSVAVPWWFISAIMSPKETNQNDGQVMVVDWNAAIVTWLISEVSIEAQVSTLIYIKKSLSWDQKWCRTLRSYTQFLGNHRWRWTQTSSVEFGVPNMCPGRI